MKKLMIAALLLLTGYAQAEVADVNIWEPYPGRSAELIGVAQEARTILLEVGLDIFVGVDQWGNLHFASGSDTWESWGELQAKAAADEKWQAFVEKYQADPSGKLVHSFHINTPIAADAKGGVHRLQLGRSAGQDAPVSGDRAAGGGHPHEARRQRRHAHRRSGRCPL